MCRWTSSLAKNDEISTAVICLLSRRALQFMKTACGSMQQPIEIGAANSSIIVYYDNYNKCAQMPFDNEHVLHCDSTTAWMRTCK